MCCSVTRRVDGLWGFLLARYDRNQYQSNEGPHKRPFSLVNGPFRRPTFVETNYSASPILRMTQES